MKSIRNKLLLAILLPVTISLLIMGVLSIWLNYMGTYSTLQQTMIETAKVSAQRIEHELNEYKNIAYETGSVARFTNESTSTEDKKAIIDQRANTYGFQRGNIIQANGISIFDGNDYSDREYFQKSMKGATAVSEPLVSKITGKLSIMISAPLWKGGIPNTEVAGVVYYVPTESFLNDIVSSIKLSPNSTAYIINRNGKTIASFDMNKVMEEENIEDLAKTDEKYASLAEIHAKMHTEQTGFASYTLDGNMFVAYASINNTDGWSLALSAPMMDFMSDTITGIIVTVCLFVLFIAIAALLALVFAGRLSRPIRLCSERLELLSQGDLSSNVPEVTTKDETAQLTHSLGDTVTSLRSIIKDISTVLLSIANKDLTSVSQRQYKGEFVEIQNSMLQITQGLNAVMMKIGQTAEQVATGAEQVSAGAQALSQGATEQASSVEELAATITEISQQVKDTADHAINVSQEMEQVGGEAEESKRRMQDMLGAMEQINVSSQEIGKIIKTIEDIAFQTNILALNAAVEAARAGVAGKGFAVVADEVRNLASKSSEASKNTAELIENAIQAVENGKHIADDTAKSLVTVVDGVNHISQTVNKISQASEQQADSVAQVTLGVDQISAVVQTNSATAQQSAASSEELSAQAQVLKQLIGQFKLRGAEHAPAVGRAENLMLSSGNDTSEDIY